MNRTTLIRSLSLGLASLAVASASLAGSFEQAQLDAARSMALDESQVANDLQAWVDAREIARLVQADGLITNDMRAEAEQYAIAMLAEADGLVTAQLQQQVDTIVVARIAAADGLVVESAEVMASLPESAPATRNSGAVLVAAAKTKR